MLDSEVMQSDWLCRLWIWCLLKSKWQDSNGISRGQFATTRPRGSEELGVTGSRFYEGLQRLCDLGCIEIESNNKATTITICNYDVYQDYEDWISPSGNNKATTKQQQSNNLSLLDEECKEGEEGNSPSKPQKQESETLRRIREERESREGKK